jgi:hypothetical protein
VYREKLKQLEGRGKVTSILWLDSTSKVPKSVNENDELWRSFKHYDGKGKV